MSDHARFSPSSSHKWLNCYGSLTLEDEARRQLGRKGDESSEYAAEGTFAHGVLERCLMYDIDPASAGATELDMIDAVQMTVDYVQMRCEKTGARILIEDRVWVTEECWGTRDIALISTHGIEVIDFKYGRGVFVDVEDNPQLGLYMLGTLRSIENPPTGKLVATIVQPRCKKPGYDLIRSQRLTLDYLKWLHAETVQAIELSGSQVYAPSLEACRWCEAKGICKAATDNALELANILTEDGVYDLLDIERRATMAPAELDMDERTTILANIELIRAQLKAVEAHSLELALSGTEIKGGGGEFKVVYGAPGHRKFRKPEAEMVEQMRKAGFRKSDIMVDTLISPAQFERLIKKLEHDPELPSEKKIEAIKAQITTPPGKRTLVPVADKRQGIALTPEQMFGNVNPKQETQQ